MPDMCASLSAKEPPLRGSAFLGASTPRAATALRPLPGAKIETCRYAATRRSAPLSLPVVLWPLCIRTACISAASDAIIFHRKWALCALAVFYIVHSVVFRKHGRCRICARRRRRKSRRYAALPYGRLRKPRAATALRPLPGAKIETCRYAAARRSAPLSLPVVLWPLCIRTACISAASDAFIFHRKMGALLASFF